MGAKVLLISNNRCVAPDPVFPLGLAHINSALRKAGHDTLWFDALAEGENIEEVLRRYRPDLVGISVRNIDDVVISKRETFFDNLKSLGEIIRAQSRCPVVIGGSGFSIFPRELMKLSGADYGICGEGETAIVALVDALINKREVSGIPALVFWQNCQLVLNPQVSCHHVLALAEEDRPKSVIDYYLRNGGMLNIQTQRGCVFHCCYCTYPVIEGIRRRRREADAVAEEFEQLQHSGCPYVFIVDSVFNSTNNHVVDICEAIIRRKVKMSWGCFLRPQGLRPELMQLMKQAGLRHIEFGTDSFCDEVLQAYGKRFTFEDVLYSSNLANQAGIDYCHFLIAGGPGESAKTLQQGFEASLRLTNAVIMAIVGMRIYPGTPLFRQAVTEGVIDAATNLLLPTYYLASGLETDGIFKLLKEFSRRSPAWIIGDPVPAYTNLIERLRKKGAVGPLWSYFSTIQRLWPQGVNQTAV